MINIVKKAGDAFKLGKYELAKYYYQLAAEQLGEKFFKNNIIICDLYLSRIQEASLSTIVRKPNIYLLNNRLDCDEYILLDSPYSIVVNEFDKNDISISIACKDNSNRGVAPAGIAKFKFYDAAGKELENLSESTSLSWSNHLNCWYFYINPDDEGLAQYQFRKPVEVKEFVMELSVWGSDSLEIQNAIEIKTQNDFHKSKSTSLFSRLNKKRGDEYFSILLNNDLGNNSYLALNQSYNLALNNLANDAEDIQISIPCFDKQRPEDKPSGIVKVKFYDSEGIEVVDLKSTNLSWSGYLKAWYFYIHVKTTDENNVVEYQFFKPQGINSIVIEFDKWQSDTLQVSNTIEILKRPSVFAFINNDYATLLKELYSSDNGMSRYKPKNTNICYVLNHSLPYQSEGYATRAQC